ncbi:hypothetical protein [Streptomyces zagrosensis]|uniref:Uncharacterized protein n=1 Tax=Streptomyces zagrosensis TaxID=1042984 RepID=A0A7W9QHR5_9ACTN|nr:hypothetical protein [Streptomyces zagrosensis]MBB5940416.1 hypothetical protein [Streptomyces zagrosensis]
MRRILTPQLSPPRSTIGYRHCGHGHNHDDAPTYTRSEGTGRYASIRAAPRREYSSTNARSVPYGTSVSMVRAAT